MSEKLKGFIQYITEHQLNVFSVRVLQGGHLFDQWHRDSDQRRIQHSISKSFTCMAVGLALEEGLLTLDSKLGDYFNYRYCTQKRSTCTFPCRTKAT